MGEARHTARLSQQTDAIASALLQSGECSTKQRQVVVAMREGETQEQAQARVAAFFAKLAKAGAAA